MCRCSSCYTAVDLSASIGGVVKEVLDWKAEFALGVSVLALWGGVGGVSAERGGLSDSSSIGSISVFSITGSWRDQQNKHHLI